MKTTAILLSLAAMFVAAAPAQAQDAKQATAVFTLTPKMTCQNCENKIKTNIRFEKGVNDIRTSIKDQTVTIKYNPKATNEEKLAAAFKKIGYQAKSVNAEAQAPAPAKK